MLLAVNVGNTHTVSGIFYEQSLIHQWRLKSDRDKTADELAIRYHSLFQLNEIRKEDIAAFIVCSVVPELERGWLEFAEKYLTGCVTPPFAVSHQTDTGLKILLPDPAELGADRIVNAAAAWDYCKTALIAIDFGTAITFDCVSGTGEYLGGAIHPGIGISLNALASSTAKLPRIALDGRTVPAIGTSTAEAIRSAALHGSGGMVDRMVDLISAEMGEKGAVAADGKISIIATGGMAELLVPYSASIDMIDPTLTLTGLRLIHERSQEGLN